MDTRKYKLPEGVGKKIVDALQKQNDNQLLADDNKEPSLAYSPINLSADLNDLAFDDDMPPDEDLLNSVSEKLSFASENVNVPAKESSMERSYETASTAFSEALEASSELPKNVKMLLKLVSQLPPNVTKQTGAMIIRQTIEAMGIPIKAVLTEAQQIQENLGFNVREYMNNIEEYRNNIKVMEEQIQICKKQSRQLADLVNLFILSEK